MKISLAPVLLTMMAVLLVGAALTAYAGNTGDGVKVKGPMIKQGPLAKVGSDLANLHAEYKAHTDKEGSDEGFNPTNHMLPVVGNRVVIDAVAAGDAAALADDLEGLGLQQGSSFGRVVSGQLPIGAIVSAAALGSLQSALPAYASTRGGLVTRQADSAMRADVARSTYGVDGAGVTVGTLSNSYDCLSGAAADVASGDLPTGVVVLEELANGDFFQCILAGGTDEGRAMMQLIHDVAPGADQAFHTAFNGQAGFALGIQELAGCPPGSELGCIPAPGVAAGVIVDDVIYFPEPMFQDGIIAQAVDTVANSGVSYFSAVGNSGRDAYESLSPYGFDASGQFPLEGDSWSEAHDFDPGPGVDIFQEITIPVGETVSFVLQWDQPFFSVSGGAGPTTDLDIFLVDIQEATALAASTSNNRIAYGGTGEPVEVFYFTNDFATETRFNVMIVNWASQTIQAGPNPTALKVARFGGNTTIQEFDTASATGYGHANAAGAEAVGAAFYGATPEYGICPLLESFSSAGGTPILLNIDGTPKAVPEVRQKPGIVAPDGVNTTFFGVDVEYDADTNLNFFGTSAAAPNAAAVAALMLETDPTLSPSEVYEALESTAIRMTHRNDSANLGSVTPGDAIVDPDGTEPDFDSGFGLIQANLAVQAVQTGPSLPRVIVTDICTYVAEGGASDSYSAVLSSQPTDDVIVTISPDNQVNVSPSSLTFTPSDWAVPQVVTVTAADDAVAEAAAAGTITHLVTSLSDTSYNGISIDDVTVNISDNDIAGVSMNTMTVAESGATDSYNMALNSEPTADVTVTVSPDAQLSASVASLIFTPGNWSTPQTVIVSAVDDLIAEGPHTGAISHAASSADPNYNYASFLSFTASIIDNDSADTTAPAFSSGSVASDGMTVTVAFDEALANSQPLGTAFVVTGSSSGDVPGTAAPAAISGADVTFTLASPLSAGETATLAYTQPLSDPRIQDAAANLTATFGGASIANNTAGAEVTVTSILPASAPNANDSFAVTITGSGFASGASVTFLNGSGHAPVASVNTVSDTTIAATLTTKKGGKPVERKWDVRVTNPGGSFGVLAEGFTITP